MLDLGDHSPGLRPARRFPRQGKNKEIPLADLIRQSVYSRLAGYEDLNDAVRVSADQR
jgi:hypothetical protein